MASSSTNAEPSRDSRTEPRPSAAFPTEAVANSSLCELCSSGLVLDDSLTGGTVERLSDGRLTLRFPEVKWKETYCSLHPSDIDGDDSICLWRGIHYSRLVTPPLLPELSSHLGDTGCCFCLALRRALVRQYGDKSGWEDSASQMQIMANYEWRLPWDIRYRPPRNIESALDWSLHSLVVVVTHPNVPIANEYRPSDFTISFAIRATPGLVRDWLGIKRQPPSLAGAKSDNTLRLIQSWLDQCGTNPDCKEKTNVEEAERLSFLPTRLLYLGQEGTAQAPVIVESQLLNTQNSHGGIQQPIYACLSYCWGVSGLPLRLTSDTLATFKTELPEKDLPQVFKDAIFVSRKLGIQYLWIDALCILQDSKDDWEHESIRMSDVFRYSYLTIGAATTSSCHESFLTPRENSDLSLEFRSNICPGISGSYTICLRDIYSKDPLDADLDISEWNKRGWVWQEQNLAPRLLVFGEQMAHLRCHRRVLSEDGTALAVSKGPSLFRHAHRHRRLSAWWMEEMMNFGARELTYARDKLAAVAGLAKAVMEVLPSRKNGHRKIPVYLAGHWLDGRFFDTLKWVIPQPTYSWQEMINRLRDCNQYCAPSWSWASRNEGYLPILSDKFREESDVSIEFISNNIEAADSDARVRTAPNSSISVRGKLLQLLRFPHPPSIPNNDVWTKFSHYRMPDTSVSWEDPFRGGQLRYCLDWDPHQPPTSSVEHEEGLLLFLVYRNSRRSHHVLGNGLILSPELRNTAGYLRVGAFSFLAEGNKDECGSLPGSDFLYRGWEEQDITLF